METVKVGDRIPSVTLLCQIGDEVAQVDISERI